MMTEDSQSSKAADRFLSGPHAVSIYTVLRVLLQMRQTFGLEAMLEYIEKYLSNLETNNPEMREAVTRVLAIVDVEKIYKQAIGKK